jgi:hypothetical protein
MSRIQTTTSSTPLRMVEYYSIAAYLSLEFSSSAKPLSKTEDGGVILLFQDGGRHGRGV